MDVVYCLESYLMCVSQKCLSVEKLRSAGPVCLFDCNGNGFCNSLGHCHCKDGFAPPFCDYPGHGGSEDSGPASDPNARKDFVTALFVIFLGIIPIIAIIGFLTYYGKHNCRMPWKKSPASYVLDYFSSTCLHVQSACKGVGSTLHKTPPPIPTISQQVANKNKGSIRNLNLEITPHKLISTTNSDVINKSPSLLNLVGVKTPNADVCDVVFRDRGNIKQPPIDFRDRGDIKQPPVVFRDSDIKQPPVKSRLSFRNIRGLKLNTSLFLNKLNNSPTEVHYDTPNTCETLCPDEEFSNISVKQLAKRFNSSTDSKKSPSKSRGATPFQQPTQKKRAEDNHSLLQRDAPQRFQNEFFGHFRGFTLIPLKKNGEGPVRPAPPVPPAPTVVTKTLGINRSNTSAAKTIFLNNSVMRSPSLNTKAVTNTVSVSNDVSVAPALPPLNPGAHPRPIISSPILENSTCTAKELISPLRNAPKAPTRPAPTAPPAIQIENKRPLSSPNAVINTVVVPEEEKKPLKETTSTLNRIASFLKSGDKKIQPNTNSLPRNVKANKVLDKNALRTIEISNPIPQKEIDLPKNSVDVIDRKAVVMRAQSMRGGTVTPRPAIPNFGSMRQPSGAKRPVSIPTGTRPKSPPPRPPPTDLQTDNTRATVKVPGLPGYQKPTAPTSTHTQNQYDDCLNSVAPLANISEENSPTSDNIYAVIDETPLKVTSPRLDLNKVKSSSGSTESVGLLGEIVSEIQNRNFDSIYSTSTLARKKKEKEDMEMKKKMKNAPPVAASETYVNTSSLYKVPDSTYSNMNNVKSGASSTSSGYINPSSVNPPIKPTVNKTTSQTPTTNTSTTSNAVRPLNTTPKPTIFSTFKSDQKPEINSYKPYSASLQRAPGLITSMNKTNNQSETTKSNNTDGSKLQTSVQTENKINNPNSKLQTSALTENKTNNPSNKLQAPVNGPPKALTNGADKTNDSLKPGDVKSTVPTSAPSKTIKPLNRQVTPPNLRTRIPSPTRTAPPAPKNSKPTKPAVSNSPDLVTSCSNNNKLVSNNNSKSPDVLNSSATSGKKPTLPNLPKTVIKNSKSVSLKNPPNKTPIVNGDAKPAVATKLTKANSDAGVGGKTITSGTKLAAKQNSTVAALQQKFENKPPFGAKISTPIKNK